MKTSSRRQTDLETILYFRHPSTLKIPITEQDIDKFFEFSEKGKHREDVKMNHFTDGFNVLVDAKQWRGVHMSMYEEGVLEGTMPYLTILGGYSKKRNWWQFWKPKFIHGPLPKSVVNFMKKDMFKGIDAHIIENTYQKILNNDC